MWERGLGAEPGQQCWVGIAKTARALKWLCVQSCEMRAWGMMYSRNKEQGNLYKLEFGVLESIHYFFAVISLLALATMWMLQWAPNDWIWLCSHLSATWNYYDYDHHLRTSCMVFHSDLVDIWNLLWAHFSTAICFGTLARWQTAAMCEKWKKEDNRKFALIDLNSNDTMCNVHVNI